MSGIYPRVHTELAELDRNEMAASPFVFSSFKGCPPMGLETRGHFPLALLGHLVSWLGLVGIGYLHYQDQTAIRELQELSGEFRALQFKARGQKEKESQPGGEEPFGDTLLEKEFPRRVREDKVPPRIVDKEIETSKDWESKWFLPLILLIVSLIGSAVGACTFAHWRKGAGTVVESEKGEEEIRKVIAQRQLAEVRLRRNGFGQ